MFCGLPYAAGGCLQCVDLVNSGHTHLYLNPITVKYFAFRFNLNLRLYGGSDLKTYLWMRGLGPAVEFLVRSVVVELLNFRYSVVSIFFISFLYLDLYVLGDDT